MVTEKQLEKVKSYFGIEEDYITLEENKKISLINYIQVLKHSANNYILLEDILKGAKISLRRGVIVITEEKIQAGIQIDYQNDLKIFFKEFKVRFNAGHRGITKYKDLYDIHPPDPCNRFEGHNNWFREYIKALEEILLNGDWLIEEPDSDETKVKNSLLSILKEVNLCKG